MPLLAGCGCEAVEESIDDRSCVKQMLKRAEGGRRRCGERVCRRDEIGPIGRNQRLTAVRQDQNKQPPTFPMHRPEHVERLTFERMSSTDDDDLLGEVLMTGSVSWVPSTPFPIRTCSNRLRGGSATGRCFICSTSGSIPIPERPWRRAMAPRNLAWDSSLARHRETRRVIRTRSYRFVIAPPERRVRRSHPDSRRPWSNAYSHRG